MTQSTATARMAMIAASLVLVAAVVFLAPGADATDAVAEPEYDEDLGEIWSYGYQFYWKGADASGLGYDFGDGSEPIYDDNSDGVIDNDLWNPVHYYEKPGTYYITVTATNSYDPEGTGEGSSTVKVYKLKVNGFPYTTYVLNNGQENITVYQESGESNATAAINVPADPVRENYVFTGWYTDEGCTTLYDFNSKVTVPVTLYAGWAQTFTVTFDVAGGSEKLDSVTVDAGASYELPGYDGTRGGYTFAGWKVGDDTFQPGDTITINGNTVITAVWNSTAHDGDEGSDGDGINWVGIILIIVGILLMIVAFVFFTYAIIPALILLVIGALLAMGVF